MTHKEMNVNTWDVPTLDESLQADKLALPVVKWGTRARSDAMTGTYHFYTDDFKFEGVWTNAEPLRQSGCSVLVEPNFSCYPDMPRALALVQIYRKRLIASAMQDVGARVVVDLNVDPRFYDIALLGVPKGWRSYATRGCVDRLDAIRSDYDLAVSHAGSDDVLFAVFGGGKPIVEECKRRGWTHVPEHMHVVEGRTEPYGQR